tara:strand:+ start:126 stop:530 length:405 start_codon:yes stop_codon:yes gene_type:complete
MTLQYSPKNNPRVIVIQKLYGKYFNKDENLTFPKHRFKKFIKDVVNGTIERDEVINDEISNHLNSDLNLKKIDKVFQVIIKSAIFEFLYKPKISSKIIINEYLRASNYFIEDGQTKYLNALLDKLSKIIRSSNG